MDVVTTSLEALIQRVIDPQNQKPDIAAIEAFCVMVNKELEGVQIACRLLASCIQSTIEWQALQALTLLDTCMKRCGPSFNSEVGKFRFLNEMIKLVSPKYLGNTTAISIRNKIISLLEEWTIDYPYESKIKEAYEMLKKQGVIKNTCDSICNSSENINQQIKVKNSILDDEKSKLLQKLLQSKNPEDLLTANRLIKTMVKEDEKRVQRDSQRLMELESVHNNVKLLSDMLGSFVPNETSKEDIELMKELYEACERLQPTLERLAQETQDSENMLAEIIEASNDLERARNKYTRVFLLDQPSASSNHKVGTSDTLLDLTTPNLLSVSTSSISAEKQEVKSIPSSQSNMELLEDIFGSLNNESFNLPHQPLLLSNVSVMQPVSILSNTVKRGDHEMTEIDSKEKALNDLDELGESCLKKNLLDPKIKGHFGKASDAPKIPLNSLLKQSELQTVEKINSTSNCHYEEMKQLHENCNTNISKIDSLININGLLTLKKADSSLNKNNEVENTDDLNSDDAKMILRNKFEVKSLTDINISLESITPGPVSPITVIDGKNGVTVILHFANDSPRPDVSVIVVTTTSKNSKPFKDYLFQAVVPNKCKCRLQPPSATELPAHNPFLPPLAISQIMLIANPIKEVVFLKFMLSYTIDEETVTEMGEIDKLPIS